MVSRTVIIWTYTFSCHAPKSGSLGLIVEMLGRVEINFTETIFNQFRADLLKIGLELKEIERIPCIKPETIL